MGEQFAVLMFFEDGKRRYVRRFVSAQEAWRWRNSNGRLKARGSEANVSEPAPSYRNDRQNVGVTLAA